MKLRKELKQTQKIEYEKGIDSEGANWPVIYRNKLFSKKDLNTKYHITL